jgi:outer membrane protein assembly factor BamB
MGDRARSWLAFIVVSFLAAAGAHAANWPQWRGPEGRGISPETSVPLEWSSDRNIAWRTPIPGRGHSQPIIWDDRVFLTTAIEGPVVEGAKAVPHTDAGKPFLHPDSVGANRQHTFKVLAIDAKTGTVLWQRDAWQGTPYDDRHKRSSYASTTPVTDGKLVYVWFGSEGLYAYDFQGHLAWKKDLGGIATLGMGTGASPILYGDLVILQCDEDSGDKSFIVALDKRDGREMWRTPRKVQVSWSTPVIARAPNGRDELVANGTEFVIAYDPATGKELWRTTGVQSNAIHTPVFGHGLVIVTAGFPAKKVIAIRLGGSGDITNTPQVAWTYEKGTAYVTSPILVGDYVYLTTDSGILTCLDAKTGEIKYEGGRPPAPSRFMASMVAVGDTLLQPSEAGDVYVVRAGPRHEIIRTNSLDETITASPAIANGRIYLRTEQHLVAIGG